MCINLSNEHLQGYFNRHIFNLEVEDCVTEGIAPLDVTYIDNKPILDLFLKVRQLSGLW